MWRVVTNLLHPSEPRATRTSTDCLPLPVSVVDELGYDHIVLQRDRRVSCRVALSVLYFFYLLAACRCLFQLVYILCSVVVLEDARGPIFKSLSLSF